MKMPIRRNESGLLKLREWRLRRFSGSRAERIAAQEAIIERLIAEAETELLARKLTRAQLVAACAHAEILGMVGADEAENISAHFGILLDDFLRTMQILEASGDIDEAHAKLKGLSFNFEKILRLASAATLSTATRKAALARYAKPSPKNDAKAFVYECWLSWQGEPGEYPSTAAFARAMLEKFPDDLTSQPVIEGWVRGWRKAAP